MTQFEVEHAFEAGWQGDAGKARGDGDGLGLSIVAI
jgi:signal transduction histidine kinase